jgi:hypothetical protein
MDPRLNRTKFAARAATLADQFQNALDDCPVGEHRGEMTAPEASTGGGVQALQHIRLVPPNASGRTYVVGRANRGERAAELRTLEYVDQVSVERFGEKSGLDPQQYAAFIVAAAQFLEMFGLVVTHASAPVRPGARPVGLSQSTLIVWAVALLVLGVALGILASRVSLPHLAN